MTTTISVNAVRYVKELYPRLKPIDAVIERYRDALDNLPPIVVARDGVLVDGYHRWQAHVREERDEISAENLGNLTDLEIRKESLRRNATHGQQLSKGEKRQQAQELYLLGVAEDELLELVGTTASSLETYLREAKAEQKRRQQEQAWDMWLDCHTEQAIADVVGVSQKTINNWSSNSRSDPEFTRAPESRQHFDVWQFHTADENAGQQSYFGALPPQVVENLLWLFTEPGQIVVDPFAGSGTTVEVAKAMGRRVWASDRLGDKYAPYLPIHKHDVADGWPDPAPRKADLILLDPPYWQQAKGRYSDDSADLGNMLLTDFYAEWEHLIKECVSHLTDDGHIAFIISPTQCEDGVVIDHALDMTDSANAATGLCVTRRIIVPYQTQQATGQQVEWARREKKLLKLYRDLVVMTR